MGKYGIIILYLVIISLVSLLYYKGKFNNIFFSAKTIPWYIAGFSYFLIYPATYNIISQMGIATQTGYSGMWIFYCSVLSAGILPVIYAPLWNKLRFMTDNQFILIRFSGVGAKILHIFRAGYVGYLVVSLFIAQIYIALAKLITIYFNTSYSQSFVLLALQSVFVIAKNSLQLKVKTDLINGIIYFAAFGIGAYYVASYFGGLQNIYHTINSNYADSIQLFPDKNSGTALETLPNILVFFFIQWWSISVLDGGGPEAQRFMNTKSRFDAFKVAFVPMILFAILFVFHSIVLDAGIIFTRQLPEQIPLINGVKDYEAVIIQLYKQALPSAMSQLVFIAFFIGLISFLEAFINWGASFIVVDLIKTYFPKKTTESQYSAISYAIMLFIAFSGLFIAYFNTHLLTFQKFVFALGAGVGPVFILRWFWWRINAWSQLTAMVTSLVFALFFDWGYTHQSSIHSLVDQSLIYFNLSYYPFKLVVLTLGVSLSWLLVTFLTHPDDKEHLHKFAQLVNPGGFWPKEFGQKRVLTFQKWILLLLLPIISILPFLFVWQLKFHSTVVGIVLFISWVLLILYVTQRMYRYLKTE